MLFGTDGSTEKSVLIDTAGVPYQYGVYGVTLRSHIPLLLPEPSRAGLAEIELRMETPSFFREAIQGVSLQLSRYSTFWSAHLKDGSTYVRWDGLGEFLVSSDGRLLTCGRLSEGPEESFQVYLLGQAISFALVNCGFEPFHATCVVVNGEAVAFLGDSGFGKSSLAAYFLKMGDRMLTDDVLLLQECAEGYLAFPGPPRIKLLPEMAGEILGGTDRGVPMNPFGPKLVLPLEQNQIWQAPVLLRRIYQLAPPQDMTGVQGIELESLTAREAFVELSCNTFNYVILRGDRLQRQITETAQIASAVPVKRLCYHREMESFVLAREAVLEDLRLEKASGRKCGS